MALKITLKAARVNVGLTQNQASKMIGVTKRTLTNWELGKSFPRKKEYIDKMCDIYKVTYDDLIFCSQNTL